nr:MAG TPA: hypothetical protein [Caudoviricetes sp.]
MKRWDRLFERGRSKCGGLTPKNRADVRPGTVLVF